jgi:hypothetical protein
LSYKEFFENLPKQENFVRAFGSDIGCKHVESGVESIWTLAYSVPTSLKLHIQFVHPTITFTAPLHGPLGVTINTKCALGQEKRKNPIEERYLASCATVVTPVAISRRWVKRMPTHPSR